MAKPPPMGHNGGFTFDSRSDIPSDVPRMFFFKFGIQDVLDDILRMPKEERGVYLTALIVMYKEMEGLPADDKMAAMSLGLDVREWRHIKPKLIARGVLYERPSGRISNRRFEAEISAYVMEYKNRREAAIERERKRKEGGKLSPRSARDRADIAERSPTYRADVAEMSATFPAGTGDDFSKKNNKNNGSPTTREARDEHEGSARARDLLVTSYESEIEVPTNKPTNRAPCALEAGPSKEKALDPRIATAIKILATLFGSETDPDHDKGYAVAMLWSQAFPAGDVLDGVMDFEARKRDRTEHRPTSEHLIGQYIRQSQRSRLGRGEAAEKVDPTPAIKVEPGPLGEGMALAPDGRIVMAPEVRAQWVNDFGGDERALDLTLMEAAAHLRSNGGESPAVQILGRLGRAVRKRREALPKRPPKLPTSATEAVIKQTRARAWVETTEPGRKKAREVGRAAAEKYFEDHLAGEKMTPDGYTVAEIRRRDEEAYEKLRRDMGIPS